MPIAKAILVPPNLGASFAGGGGASVAANIAQAMLEANLNVTLLALTGYSNKTLDDLHGTNLSTYCNRLTSNYIFKRKVGNYGAHRIATAKATSLTLLAYHCHLFNRIDAIRPKIIWFNDDVPKICEKKLRDYDSLQYVNFALHTRLRVCVDEQWEKYDTKDEPTKKHYRGSPFLTKLLVGENALGCKKVIANSSVTCRYIRMTTDNINPLIIHPPVKIANFHAIEKKNQVVAVGAFRANKRFGDIIRALKLSRRKDLQLVIVGLLDDDDYFAYLARLTRELDLQRQVKLIPNGSSSLLEKVLSESSAILSAARFEPFGISIAEGMSFGCVPIAYAGEDSGPWVDIMQRGRFGHGFRDIRELSEILGSLPNRVDEGTISALKNRALTFSNVAFRESIKTFVLDMLA
ncbi:MAG TPA: glycosyltransferase [Candidatus Sulfotelmatobacter sp.]|nr:glycosyltransferase [Candidatus Sulfotelmatobacter sp.]